MIIMIKQIMGFTLKFEAQTFLLNGLSAMNSNVYVLISNRVAAQLMTGWKNNIVPTCREWLQRPWQISKIKNGIH